MRSIYRGVHCTVLDYKTESQIIYKMKINIQIYKMKSKFILFVSLIFSNTIFGINSIVYVYIKY